MDIYKNNKTKETSNDINHKKIVPKCYHHMFKEVKEEIDINDS